MGLQEPGDKLPAGLTLHVIHVRDNGLNYAGRAGFCGLVWDAQTRQWRPIWRDDKPPAGVIWIRTLEGYNTQDYELVQLHEIGHVVGVVGGAGRWGREHYVTTNGSAPYYITHPTVVAAFNQSGGSMYPGRRVPVDRGGVHWHSCIASTDRMAGGERLTNLTLSTLWPGFIPYMQGDLDERDRSKWPECPEFSSSRPAWDSPFGDDVSWPDPPKGQGGKR